MIDQLDLLPGTTSATPPRKPSEPIVRSAVLETVGPYGYRWVMHRAWGNGPTILWALLNPSDADGKRDDPTTHRMMQFSFRWGFGSMIVCNLYPVVSSKPADMRAWRKTWDWKAYEHNGMRPWDLDKTTWSAFYHNMGLISKVLTPDMTCVAAWGNGAPESDVHQFMCGVRLDPEGAPIGMLGEEMDWHCLGKTADGSPIHPLARGKHRVPDDATLKMWKRKPRRSPERSSCL